MTSLIADSIRWRMVARDRRLLLLLLAAIATGFMALDVLAGLCMGTLHFAPFFALLVPLLVGRYPGEAMIARARTQRPRHAIRLPPCWPSAPVSWPSRPLVSQLVIRPPPQLAFGSA